MAGHNSRYKTLLNSSDFPSVVRRLHFTGSKLTIICSLMTTLKTCIRTITYLSDIGCLEIQGASLRRSVADVESIAWISEHNARLLVVPAVALIHYLNEMCQSTETAVNDAFCRTLTRESLAIP